MALSMLGIMVPIMGMILTGVVIFIVFYYRYRERTKLHDTLRSLAESNSPHQAELLAALTRSTVPQPQRDLRAAIILIGIALGLAAMAFLVGLESGGYYEVVWPLLAISVFPLAFGIGRFILWRMAVKRGED